MSEMSRGVSSGKGHKYLGLFFGVFSKCFFSLSPSSYIFRITHCECFLIVFSFVTVFLSLISCHRSPGLLFDSVFWGRYCKNMRHQNLGIAKIGFVFVLVFVFVIVFLLVRACLLTTLINCLKGPKSQVLLFLRVFSIYLSLSLSLTYSLSLSFCWSGRVPSSLWLIIWKGTLYSVSSAVANRGSL